MLFDPGWEKTFTTASLAAWLEKQPKDERYSFVDVDHCAAAQYLRMKGLDPAISCDRLKQLGWIPILCAPGHETFGQAATRARLIARGGWRLSIAKFFGVAGL